MKRADSIHEYMPASRLNIWNRNRLSSRSNMKMKILSYLSSLFMVLRERRVDEWYLEIFWDVLSVISKYQKKVSFYLLRVKQQSAFTVRCNRKCDTLIVRWRISLSISSQEIAAHTKMFSFSDLFYFANTYFKIIVSLGCELLF